MSSDNTAASISTDKLKHIRTSLVIIALLATAYTLYFAKGLLIPIVIALFLSLLLSPAVQYLKRIHVPASLSSIILIISLGTPFVLLGMQLVEPAEKWVKVIPDISAQIGQKLEPLDNAFSQQEAEPQKTEKRKFLFFTIEEEPDEPPETQKKQNPVSEKIAQSSMEALFSFLTETPIIIAQAYAVVILLLFFLIFGPGLYRTMIEVTPCFSNQEHAHHFFEDTQRELSHYIWTVSLINTGLGITVGAALYAMGAEDPVFWATLAALLNFAPYVGPVIGIFLLGLAGVVQYGPQGAAALPALIYFLANVVESQVITPLVLGRNMRLNPLVVLVWLLAWGWLWGFAGLLLAVPLLVCLKLSFSRFNLFPKWLQLIESPTMPDQKPAEADTQQGLSHSQ